MKTALRIRSLYLVKSAALLALFFVFGLSELPIHAATDTARVVKYAQNDIVPIKAKLRYSTLIILPEKEEILDFTTGDKEFWIINGAHNLCYIHPAQAGIRSNLNLITASGHVYSFLLSEISSDPNADPDLKIVIEPKEESGIGTGAFAQGYVPATEAEAYKREIQTIRDQANAQVQTAQASAQQQMQKFRSEYSTKLQFDYQFDSKGSGEAVPSLGDLSRRHVHLHQVRGFREAGHLRNQRWQAESHQLRTPERRLHRPENRGHRLSGHWQEETRLFPPPVRSASAEHFPPNERSP